MIQTLDHRRASRPSHVDGRPCTCGRASLLVELDLTPTGLPRPIAHALERAGRPATARARRWLRVRCVGLETAGQRILRAEAGGGTGRRQGASISEQRGTATFSR